MLAKILMGDFVLEYKLSRLIKFAELSHKDLSSLIKGKNAVIKTCALQCQMPNCFVP